MTLGEGEVHVQSVASDPRFALQAGALIEAWGRVGAKAVRHVTSGAPADLRFVHVPTLPAEAYALVGDGPIEVQCGDPSGAARAAATLFQLTRVPEGTPILPVVHVTDQPDLPFRGMMVDMGRNPHGPETLRRLVDLSWLVKANVLHLHLSDDQLFSWPSRAYPGLYSERAGWTWEAFEALEAYAVARGVMLVPELDVPGHSTILRREYPEVFGKTPTDLATSDAATQGVATLIAEFCSVFRSSAYVHVGGDEAYGVPVEAQRAFLNRLNEVVRANGKRTLVWEGPPLGEGDNKVAESVVHVNWNTVNFRAQAMLDAGYSVVNAAWDPFYVVDHYPRTMFTAVSLDRLYGWNPRSFAHIDHGYPTFAQPEVTTTSEGILGCLMPWWEGREENVLALCAPRLMAAAAGAWNRAGEQDFEGFLPRLEVQLALFEVLAGVELPKLPYADPAAEADNLAYRGRVSASRGAHQPHFGPERLTNGLDDRFDHFLGFPTQPEPLEIVIELRAPALVGRVVVYETAVGKSHELYELWVSPDGEAWERVGKTEPSSRGEANHVVHTFAPRRVAQLKLLTSGCHGLTFPSFSRLTEVRAYAE